MISDWSALLKSHVVKQKCLKNYQHASEHDSDVVAEFIQQVHGFHGVDVVGPSLRQAHIEGMIHG